MTQVGDSVGNSLTLLA